jgi:hypothetical protein
MMATKNAAANEADMPFCRRMFRRLWGFLVWLRWNWGFALWLVFFALWCLFGSVND